MDIEDFEIRQGRPRRKIDLKKVMEMHRNGETLKYIGEQLGVSYVTIWKRIQEAKKEQGKL